MLDDMAVTKERVAEQLKGLRELHGAPGKLLSTEKAAAKADVSSREWQRLEKKEIQNAHSGTLSKIADAYEIPLDSFDNGRPEKRSSPLAERLDEIDRKLDEILEILKEEEITEADEDDDAQGVPDALPHEQDHQQDAPSDGEQQKRQEE